MMLEEKPAAKAASLREKMKAGRDVKVPTGSFLGSAGIVMLAQVVREMESQSG